jgi:hypothetical protein
MANLLHIKGSRTQVLNSFPTRSFGKDGDIIISKISGKGTYLCSKAGGSWYTANKLQELSKLEKTSIRDLSVSKLSINNMINSSDTSDRFLVNNNGRIQYRTNPEVSNDLNILDINYKTAHCSLSQYADKESCEAGGGTWYYSENDSHDNVSSTAENQLLTVGESIGNLDAEPTLLYDGSTLEIKYNSDYDDNWQTSTQTDLLKLSYDSSKNAIFNVDSSGNLTINCTNDITLDAVGGNIYFEDTTTPIARLDSGITQGFTLYSSANSSDYLKFTTTINGASTIATNDNDGTSGNLTLDIDGDITLDADGGDIVFEDNGVYCSKINTTNGTYTIYGTPDDSNDFGYFSATTNGATAIGTVDAAGSDADFTLDIDGDIIFDSHTGVFIAKKAGTEFSAANSAYAGMILGYTCIGLNEAHASINLTTSYVVPTDEFSVSFTAPPSGNVEIQVQVQHHFGSSGIGDLYAGLSTANATSGYSALASHHEFIVNDGQGRNAYDTIQILWTLTGLTAGDDYEYWAGFKAPSTTGTPKLQWGGTSTGRYGEFIMKATALPATITT